MSKFQVNSTIIVSAKHRVRSVRLPFLVLTAVLGSICTLAVCLSMVEVQYEKLHLWLTAAAAVGLTCGLSLLPKGYHLLGYLPFLTGAVYSAMHRKELIIGAKLFYNAFYSEAHHTETSFFELQTDGDEKKILTLFLCCTAAVLCSLISRSVIHKTSFIAFFILTFIPVEFGLYEGLEMNLFAMCTLVALWFTVLAVSLASHSSSNKIDRNSVRSVNTANCGIAAMAITSAAVITAVFVCNPLKLTSDEKIQEKRSEMRSSVENFDWQNLIDNVADIGISLGFLDDPDLRKLGDQSRLEYKYEDEVKLIFDTLPEQGFYLKNYTGSVYENNSWIVLSDKVWDKEENLDSLFNKFACVPQVLPFMSNQAIPGYGEKTNVEIENLKRNKAALLPYGAYSTEKYTADTGISVSGKKPYSYEMSVNQNYLPVASMPLNNYYLPSSGFNFNDSTTSEFFGYLGVVMNEDTFIISGIQAPFLESSKYATQSLQSSLTESYLYRDFVYRTYTEAAITDELEEVYSSLPSELIEIGKSGSEINILHSIRRYLDSQCDYTLSPGLTPSTRDFVNYFLTENNKGYCTHFATAGTVLARYFGIPARYCEGYVVAEEDMAKAAENEDGTVTLSVQDSSAHAWCEYYIDGYGWVPYEFTPGYYKEQENPTPQVTDVITQEQTVTSTTEINASEPDTTETTATTVTTTTDGDNGSGSDSDGKNNTSDSGKKASEGGFLKVIKVLLYIAAVIAAIAVIGFLLILLRNFFINRKMRLFRCENRKEGIFHVYAYLMKLLKYMGITPQNAQSLEFLKEVKAYLNELDYESEGAEKIITLALAADMGDKTPEKEDIRLAIKYVSSLAKYLKENTKPVKRIIYMYIYHLF